MRVDEIRALHYGELLDYLDFVYEQQRDADNLDPEAETAYQSRQYRKLREVSDG